MRDHPRHVVNCAPRLMWAYISCLSLRHSAVHETCEPSHAADAPWNRLPEPGDFCIDGHFVSAIVLRMAHFNAGLDQA